MNYSVEQTQSQVNASAEALKQNATVLRDRVTEAKHKISTEATSRSNATFMKVFDADFGTYLNKIEAAADQIIATADDMMRVASIQQKASETEIQH